VKEYRADRLLKIRQDLTEISATSWRHTSLGHNICMCLPAGILTQYNTTQ